MHKLVLVYEKNNFNFSYYWRKIARSLSEHTHNIHDEKIIM